MVKPSISYPRLPSNWNEQPGFFPRIWDKAMGGIESNIANIEQVLIDLGLVTVTADGALALASSAINPDSTIKDDKVVTPSIINNGVNKPYFVQNLTDVTLTDGVDVVICSVSPTKDLTDSDLQISATVRMNSSDDLRGTFTFVRDGTVIDTIPLYANVNNGSFKIPLTLLYRDTAASTGSHTYTVNFQRTGGASTVLALAGSNLEVVEVKR